MFHDRARIWVEGGRGGDGCVSFRREAHVPRGGPDGGDGGRGGDVVLVCDPSRRDLAALRIARHFRAGRGGHGRGKQQHGARGDDREVQVPPGTSAEGADGAAYDLTDPGQRAVVAAGGEGGHGNKRFATSTRQAPRFAERGLPGEEGWIELRLRLLADAGVVGLPNAGKSSLLAALTRARPKVADYPFTTIDPVLGTIDDGERQLVLADIPGLIEGAAQGAGLGHEFLAHVERCRALVHLVAIDPFEERDPGRGLPHGARRARCARGRSRPSCRSWSRSRSADLATDEELERIRTALAEEAGRPVLAISSATGSGLDELTRALSAMVGPEPPAAADDQGFDAEHMIYRPAGEQGFDVVREDDAFRVHGRGIEMLVARHDLSNHEALLYLEARLREIGVIAALERAGFEPGDEVRIGDEEFELDPG